MATLRELSLFTGAGGGLLASKLLGWQTVAACEIEPAARAMLQARQRDGVLEHFPIWDDVTTFDGKPFRGHVDIITGGFPCQDISCAGTGAGITGERSGLWKEYARIIDEARPAFVFAENSPLLASRGLGVVVSDLAAMGYDVRWGVLGAWHVGGNHRRDRIWVLAFNPDSNHCSKRTQQRGEHYGAKVLDGRGEIGVESGADVAHAALPNDATGQSSQGSTPGASVEPRRSGGSPGSRPGERPADGGEVMADAYSQRPQGQRPDDGAEGWEAAGGSAGLCDGTELRRDAGWWGAEPRLDRVAHGVANRVDRLKAIGNGQVPTVAAVAFKLLASDLSIGGE